MNRYKKFRIPTVDAVAAACAVYRHLGQTVKKSELNNTSPTSKDMLLDHFSGNSQIIVTDEDRIRGQAVADYILQRNVLDTLTGQSISPFLLSVAGLLEKESVSSSDFGILAWAPKLADDLAARDDRTQDIRSAFHDSRYVGTIGKGLALEFHVMSSTYVKSYDRYILTGHDGAGNAITFWHPTRLTGVCNIKARVKEHAPLSRYGNVPGTRLNYVKVK